MTLPQDFARTGFTSQLQEGATITRYQVLGERSSGTNFVKRLLGRNSNLKPTEALGWKHGFGQSMAIPPDLAVICVVRRADDWARSMHAKPWHTTPALQSLGFSEFIRAPWDTIIDRPRYFDGAHKAGIVGQPLMQDRHPLTGARFDNVFALRQVKLQGMLSYLRRDCTVIVLRMEEAGADPQGCLARLLDALRHPHPDHAFRPVFKRLGSKFKASVPARPDTPKQWSEDDQAYLKTAVDAAQEAALGYHY